VSTIAGADCAVAGHSLVGCIGVFSYPDLELFEYQCAHMPNTMPYIPGFLSFREVPVLIKCYNKLRTKPDLLLVDGQGIAHPRSIGLASHLGIILRKPTIGCAKSHLYGSYEMPHSKRGSTASLKVQSRDIGIVLRTRDKTKPLWVSPGHLVNIEDCREYILSSTRGYRLPEPIRFAHMKAGETARRMNV
jgi:deoxyribonuclease V